MREGVIAEGVGESEPDWEGGDEEDAAGEGAALLPSRDAWRKRK